MATCYTFKYQGDDKLKKVKEVVLSAKRTMLVYKVNINNIDIIIKPDSKISEIIKQYFSSPKKQFVT